MLMSASAAFTLQKYVPRHVAAIQCSDFQPRRKIGIEPTCVSCCVRLSYYTRHTRVLIMSLFNSEVRLNAICPWVIFFLAIHPKVTVRATFAPPVLCSKVLYKIYKLLYMSKSAVQTTPCYYNIERCQCLFYTR
jgi:hypothetical protein